MYGGAQLWKSADLKWRCKQWQIEGKVRQGKVSRALEKLRKVCEAKELKGHSMQGNRNELDCNATE